MCGGSLDTSDVPNFSRKGEGSFFGRLFRGKYPQDFSSDDASWGLASDVSERVQEGLLESTGSFHHGNFFGLSKAGPRERIKPRFFWIRAGSPSGFYMSGIGAGRLEYVRPQKLFQNIPLLVDRQLF